MRDEDVTSVSYKVFNKDEANVYPSMGLCFSNVIIDEKIEEYGIMDPFYSNWSTMAPRELYNGFLAGGYWNQDMLKLDYDYISKNIADYVLSYRLDTTHFYDFKEIYNVSIPESANKFPGEVMKRSSTTKEGIKVPYIRDGSFMNTKCVLIDIHSTIYKISSFPIPL